MNRLKRALFTFSLFSVLQLSTPALFVRWPGTKWCGIGNDATSFDDLAEGAGRSADACCREHDNCDKIVPPFRFKYKLFNLSLFPVLECSCDKTFFDCLKSLGADDVVANGVGTLYFTKLVKRCFNYNKAGGASLFQQTPSWNSTAWNIGY